MSAVTQNHHIVTVDNEQEVWLMARRRPAEFPGFVFHSAKEQDDGTWKVFFVREEAAEHAYRQMIKRKSN